MKSEGNFSQVYEAAICLFLSLNGLTDYRCIFIGPIFLALIEDLRGSCPDPRAPLCPLIYVTRHGSFRRPITILELSELTVHLHIPFLRLVARLHRLEHGEAISS